MYSARITSCGCMMRIVGERLVVVNPCNENCEAMLDAGPERARHPFFGHVVRIPEEAA
jgi:hypothetical protein